MRTYTVNEMFYSIQGEGARVGTANVFVRFSGCNLACNVTDHGFDCDTDWSSGRSMSAQDIRSEAIALMPHGPHAVIFTGGEPALQLDEDLVTYFTGWHVAVETNGTKPLVDGIDFVSVSPKTAEHTICARPSEVRYVRAHGQAIPRPGKWAAGCTRRYISPAFEADGTLRRDTLNWCIGLVKENPAWALSIQTHKLVAQR